MSFEEFAKDDPSQIVLGLFNGELQAVYLFKQISLTEFEAHFTSSRKAKREDVLAGARQMVEWFNQNGLKIVAHVSVRNVPLARFVESAGLSACRIVTFTQNSSCQTPNESDRLASTVDTFTEFRSVGEPPSGFQGQNSNLKVQRIQ